MELYRFMHCYRVVLQYFNPIPGQIRILFILNGKEVMRLSNVKSLSFSKSYERLRKSPGFQSKEFYLGFFKKRIPRERINWRFGCFVRYLIKVERLLPWVLYFGSHKKEYKIVQHFHRQEKWQH